MRILHLLLTAVAVLMVTAVSASCGHRDSTSPQMLAPVSPSPANPNPDAGIALPAPAQLKVATEDEAGRVRLGAEFETLLPPSLVSDEGTAARFKPDFSPGDGRLDMAYALYSFTVTGHADRLELLTSWDQTQQWSDLWAAVADFDADNWRWYSVPVGGQISIENVEPLLANNDAQLVVVILATGTAEWLLNRLEVIDFLDGRAQLAVDPAIGHAPLEVTLDASGTANPGDVLRYEWDFYGNSEFADDTTTNEQTANILYAGDYQPRVRVSYEDGSVSIARTELIVLPKRYLSLSPDLSDPDWEGVEGSGTLAAPYEILVNDPATDFRFEVEEHGQLLDPQELQWVVNSGGEAPVQWDTPGVLTIIGQGTCDVLARDDLGQETNVVRLRAKLNQPPVVQFTADPQSGPVPLAVTFDASQTYDPDSDHPGFSPDYLEWDFDGDEVFDLKQQWPSAVASFCYGTPGTYQATLKVTDYDDGWAVASLAIQAEGDPEGPHWHLTRLLHAYLASTVGIVDAGGHPAIAYQSKVADSVGLTYVRAADPRGEAWNSAVILDAGEPPGYSDLDMSLINGAPAITYCVGNFYASALKYIAANDATGFSWTPAIEVDANGGWVVVKPALAQINDAPAIAYDAVGGDAETEAILFSRYDGVSMPNGWSSPVSIEPRLDVGHGAALLEVDGHPAVSYGRRLEMEDRRLVYSRAADAAGSDWGNPLVIDGASDAGMYSSMTMVNGLPALVHQDYTNRATRYIRANDAQGGSWGGPVDIMTYQWPTSAWFTRLLEAQTGPVMVCVNSEVYVAAAKDNNGDAWDEPTAVWSTGSVWALDTAIVDGHLALAFIAHCDYGTELWAGVLY